MSSLDWVPELAAALDELVPLDDGSSATWDDVVARAGSRRRLWIARRQPGYRLRVAIVVTLVFFLLAGVATATYLALRSSPAGLIIPRTKEPAFAMLDANGRPHDIWRCPRTWICDIPGVALSPDGRQLALSLGEIGGQSTNVGMHMVDVRTGAVSRIPDAALRGKTNAERLDALVLRQVRIFGCVFPSNLAWSPDGSRLAYSCATGRGLPLDHIYTIRPDGTGRRLVPTHAFDAVSATWSPDAKRIAFSSCFYPVVERQSKFGFRSCRSSVYVVDVDGRNQRRLAPGSLPDWSPDGRTIAYVSPGCHGADSTSWRIRLMTPTGRDVTPGGGGCAGIGPPQSIVPAWSPDGRRIAIAAETALYVMNADGSGLERVLRGNFLNRGFGGPQRPLWKPLTKGQR
jgi:hypothetical protein